MLRLENLDTDLALPPEAVAVTRVALDDPVSNSWLPFTGDLGLRAAISDQIFGAPRAASTTRCREIVVTCGGTEGVLDVLLATSIRATRSCSPTRSTRGSSTACGWRAACRRVAPLAVVDGEWRLDRDALRAAGLGAHASRC